MTIAPFSVVPKPQNKLARYVMAACFGSFFIFIVLSMLMESYKGVISLAALVFATAGIFIYNKYVYTTYAYEVSYDTDGTPVFTVRHTQRKSMATLCRIELSSIVSVTMLTKAERKERKCDRTVPRYFYCPTMSADKVYLIQMRTAHEKADVFVELTDEAASLLRKYAAEARDTVSEE